MIHNLSYAQKQIASINEGISDESAAVQQAGINEAIQEIKRLGRQVCLSKGDVPSAFRTIKVSPNDYELLGFKWKGMFYCDRCLPFGCRTRDKIFEEFISALKWIAVNISVEFLIISKSKEEAITNFAAFISLCEYIGVPYLLRKRSLHQKSRFCTLKKIQSLIGVLNFACSVIQPGRAFLRRIINLPMKVSETQKHLYISEMTKEDMRIWLKFLNNFNGKLMFLN